MISSLDRSSPVMRHPPEWPDGPQPHTYPSGALFERRPPLRKLVVLADADLLAAPGDGTLSPTVLLTGLLTHPYIKLLRYRDAGLPADTPWKEDRAEVRAELLPPDNHERRSLVYAHRSEQAVCTAVYGTRAEYARGDTSSIAYRAAATMRQRTSADATH